MTMNKYRVLYYDLSNQRRPVKLSAVKDMTREVIAYVYGIPILNMTNQGNVCANLIHILII